jgi:hypothetical protein
MDVKFGNEECYKDLIQSISNKVVTSWRYRNIVVNLKLLFWKFSGNSSLLGPINDSIRKK